MDVPAIVVKPGDGRSVSLGGMGVVFKVSGADTGGAFAVVEHPIEAGRLVLPHFHLHEDEYSNVLEGTIGARSATTRWLPDRAATCCHEVWSCEWRWAFVGQRDQHTDFTFAYGAPVSFVSNIKLRKAHRLSITFSKQSA
jgi:hypothetical protein